MPSAPPWLILFSTTFAPSCTNLAEDVGEEHDLSEPLADKAAQLQEELHAWREAVDAQMPAPNPAYDPSRPEHTR